MRVRGFAVLLSCALLLGCRTGAVTVREPMQSIPDSKCVAVRVKPALPEWQRDADHLGDELVAAFDRRSWWQNRRKRAVDVVLDITIVGFEKGDAAIRAMTSGDTGDAWLVLHVVARRADGTSLGAFDVTGNSKRYPALSIRYGASLLYILDDLPDRAIDASVEQIVDYLEEHR